MGRVAVLDRDRCKPKECGLPCVKYCPEVRNRVEAIRLDKTGKWVEVSEALCSGCGICVKKCPFKALLIINLPEELDVECSYRYGPNAFKLFRLPVPKERTVSLNTSILFPHTKMKKSQPYSIESTKGES